MNGDGKQSDSELFLLEAWVADNPGSQLYLKLARLFKERNRFDQAVEVLQRGLVIHPGDVEARGLLAEVLELKGDIPGALGQLKIAASAIKQHSRIFQRLTQLLEAQGEEKQATSARKIAVALAEEAGFDKVPTEPAPPSEDTATMAEIYAGQGHTEQAAAIYQRILAGDPSRDDIRQRLNELTGPAPLPSASQAAVDRLNAFKKAALSRLGAP
jgi:tetratricopeptide (TPR) repeat protein